MPRESPPAPRSYRDHDAELPGAVARFVADHPDVRMVVISIARQTDFSLVLRIEIADDVIAFVWNTRRSMVYAAARQADRLHALLAGSGLHVYKSRHDWLRALERSSSRRAVRSEEPARGV